MHEVRSVDDLLWASPMPEVCRERLRAWLRYMVAHWPLGRPIRLTFRRVGGKNIAVCKHTPQGYRLTIDSRANFHQALELLNHEYSHAVAWEVDPTDHGPAWGGIYTDITRACFDGTAYEDSDAW